MQRKLIKQGQNALTVTLPAKWLQKMSLKGGDEVEVIEHEKEVIITTEKKQTEFKTSIDISNLDSLSFNYLITKLYEKGYDEVEIIYTKDKLLDFKTNKEKELSEFLHKLLSRLIGFEILSKKQNKYLITYIAAESEKEFDNMLRRLFLMVLELNDSIKNAIKHSLSLEKFPSQKEIDEMHDTIHKIQSYCLRLLNKKYIENEQAYQLFYIINLLNKIADYSTYYLSYDLLELKKQNRFSLNKEVAELLIKTLETVRLYYNLFYDFNEANLKKLFKERYDARKKADNINNAPIAQIRLLTRYSAIYEIIQELVKSKMLMKY